MLHGPTGRSPTPAAYILPSDRCVSGLSWPCTRKPGVPHTAVASTRHQGSRRRSALDREHGYRCILGRAFRHPSPCSAFGGLQTRVIRCRLHGDHCVLCLVFRRQVGGIRPALRRPEDCGAAKRLGVSTGQERNRVSASAIRLRMWGKYVTDVMSGNSIAVVMVPSSVFRRSGRRLSLWISGSLPARGQTLHLNGAGPLDGDGVEWRSDVKPERHHARIL